ncbi:polymer-forming cytoskeletal protein [Erwinia persicina]|uniref:bactofilin family protein n=1 Tax=Erwinia persicina TaxID=55211 RepID=UPI00210286D8|nr:polymer-forming cytoskeletal protein [Erwinia persicina]MCQ4107557.1 polymer-forming cytoskeletal protein [Erwinia persicina]UTX12682.1 polymer-forming cytoskeletal protein [Erwinia persicina]
MSETKKQGCLWGIWLCWGVSISAFLLSTRTVLLLSLAGMACFSLLLIISSLHTKRMFTNVFNFNRKEEDRANEKLPSPVKVEPSTLFPSSLNDDNSTKETVISIGTVLRGEVTNENNITINGVVEGDLTSQKSTQIGKEGKVIGKIKSLKLVVNGLLKGSCYARTVIIMSRGRIEGEVYANEFSIEKGGVFIGNSHQIEEPQALPDKKDKKLLAANSDRTPVLTAVEQKAAKIPPVSEKK